MADFFNENLAPSVTQETDAALVSLGQRGFDSASGDTVEANYAAVQCVTDCTFAEITALNSNSGALIDTTIPAGTILYGAFTKINANSGTYIAYKA